MPNLRRLSLTFTAGAVGALLASLLMWFCGALGITEHFSVAIKPNLTLDWLYPRLIWGGLFGLIFAFSFLDRYLWLRSLLISLIPSVVALFIVFPILLNKGVMGVKLGELTPYFVLIMNGAWGLGTGWWLRVTGEG